VGCKGGDKVVLQIYTDDIDHINSVFDIDIDEHGDIECGQ